MKKPFTNRSRLLKFCTAKMRYARSPHLVILLLLTLLSVSAYAQNKVTGTVRDDKGETMPGVSIKVQNTTNGVVSDINGKYTLTAAKGSVLVFSFVGYSTKNVTIGDNPIIDVTLSSSAAALNEVVVVGYGTQKKASLTTAVSQVSSSEIVTTKNENVENMLTGKVAGLTVQQNTSEPGQFDNNISIRAYGGNPLIVIDGVAMPNFSTTGGTGDNSTGSSNIFARLDPNDIESISVLKDASASVYGVNGANGVILVTTKRGKKGALQLEYSGTVGAQVPSDLPKPVDAIGYMTLVNQQALHNVQPLVYSPADFTAYQNGSKKSTDWYDATFKKSTFQQQHNLTASGGNDNTTYMISGGYSGQDGLLVSNDLNYRKYNVRSNVTSHITKNLTVNLSLSGLMDQTNAPITSVWYTTRETWRELPVQPIYANNNPSYLQNGAVDGGNPVAYENSNLTGYNTQKNQFFNSQLSIDYKIPYVDGLTLKALYSYNTQIQDNKQYQANYNLYDYDASSNVYNASLKNSPSYVQRQYYQYPANTDQLSLNYIHSFFGAHNVNALLLYEGNARSEDNFAAYRQVSLPVDQIFAGNVLNQSATQDVGGLYHYATNSLVGRLHYDFKERYLIEGSFREDQSSRFSPEHSKGFFPAVSGAWVVSEEKFWKNTSALNFIDQLKFRASWGKTGDDQVVNYQFLNGYNYPAGGSNNQLPGGAVFNGNYVNAISFTNLANPDVTWETSKTFDAGLDLSAWKGMFTFTIDYFRRDRSGLFASSTAVVPDVLGVSLPQENINSDRSEGFDLELTHTNHIGKFKYNVRGTFSFARIQNVYHVESPQGNSYLDWRNLQSNRLEGIAWGQTSLGQYSSYASILNSGVFVNRNTVVGDYIYQDWNGDGQVDGNDYHPIAYTGTPKVTYGLSLGGSYQNFDFNVLFQGSAMVDVSYIEQLNIPLWGGGSALTQFLNDYHPTDPTADPFNPNTVWTPGHFAYTGTTADVNSTANYHSAAYVRLKSAELGYSLPNGILKSIGVRGVRVFANGYNLLTFTSLKYLDPEHPSGTYGYLYPLDKLFNVGLNVKF